MCLAGQDRAGQGEKKGPNPIDVFGRAGQGRAGQVRAGQATARQGRALIGRE